MGLGVTGSVIAGNLGMNEILERTCKNLNFVEKE